MKSRLDERALASMTVFELLSTATGAGFVAAGGSKTLAFGREPSKIRVLLSLAWIRQL